MRYENSCVDLRVAVGDGDDEEEEEEELDPPRFWADIFMLSRLLHDDGDGISGADMVHCSI